MKYQTIDEFRKLMELVSGKEISDDDLIWFCCIQEAKLLFDTFSLKDVANIFLTGMSSYSLDQVQEFLDTYYEDCDDTLVDMEEEEEESFDENVQSVNHQIEQMVKKFYGKD